MAYQYLHGRGDDAPVVDPSQQQSYVDENYELPDTKGESDLQPEADGTSNEGDDMDAEVGLRPKELREDEPPTVPVSEPDTGKASSSTAVESQTTAEKRSADGSNPLTQHLKRLKVTGKELTLLSEYPSC